MRLIPPGVCCRLVVSTSVSSFVAVAFKSAAAAEDALSTVHDLGSEPDVSVRDAVVVVRTERGSIELQQTREVAPGDAAVGVGSAGLVAGLLLGLPVAGALLGLAGGTLFGLRDTGIPDSRLRKLGAELEPGHAVLCVLVDAGVGMRRAHEALGRYGTVVDVELSSDTDP
jgi:uncharacterized membrane protein